MDKIEKIKAEIERRKNELEKDKYINIDAKVCRTSELTYLERFIDSLPTETSGDLEEAARYVYESWMGGTMDDVRRDMVELGKALNARKED